MGYYGNAMQYTKHLQVRKDSGKKTRGECGASIHFQRGEAHFLFSICLQECIHLKRDKLLSAMSIMSRALHRSGSGLKSWNQDMIRTCHRASHNELTITPPPKEKLPLNMPILSCFSLRQESAHRYHLLRVLDMNSYWRIHLGTMIRNSYSQKRKQGKQGLFWIFL